MSRNRVYLMAGLALTGLVAAAVAVGVPAASGRASHAQIAFSRLDPGPPWTAHLFVINPDGSGLRQLTNAQAWDRDESWSPDGARLLFDRWTDDGYMSDVYVVGANGEELRQLTHDGDSSGAAWSPDGGWIVYGSGSRLLLMDSSGSGRREITRVRGSVRGPSWSPDGKRIAFGAGDGIVIVNADGTGKRRLTRDGKGGGGVVWSPHGDRLAFVGGSRGHRYGYIYVINPDRRGVRVRLVTRHAYNESGFTWSPDGKRIVYAREGGGGVYMIDADGTHDRRLTIDSPRPDGSVGGFAWSPDTSKLALASDSSGNGDIYVMDMRSHRERQLTQGVAIDGYPRWWPSPR
jgi:Tol biopolymer transport system component